jgi:hypothetical protein
MQESIHTLHVGAMGPYNYLDVPHKSFTNSLFTNLDFIFQVHKDMTRGIKVSACRFLLSIGISIQQGCFSDRCRERRWVCAKC